MSAGIGARFAFDRHRILGKNRGSVKKRAVVLTTVEAMTKANSVRPARRHETYVAATAPAGETVHVAHPRNDSFADRYTAAPAVAIVYEG